MLEINKIYNIDCLEGMKLINDKSVDMILCDLPYEKTRNKWDITISLVELWKQYKRIIKYRGAIILTSVEPFTTKLIMSNQKLFKYKMIWEKTIASGQLNCNYAPLRIFEEILIFSKASACYVKNKEKAMIYNPQFNIGEPYKIKRNIKTSNTYDYQKPNENINNGYRYPTDIIKIANPRIKNGHPTQKPIELCEYLIRTYTNENELVLDNCIGSGTTAIACINTNRNYIGFELEKKYFDLAIDRIQKHNNIATQ